MKTSRLIKLTFVALVLGISTISCCQDKTTSNVENGEGRHKGHTFVDLGLSVKWATCNVGAASPEDYGDYYAWGETETKSTYSWWWSTTTYKWCKGTSDTLTKYCTSSRYGTVDNKTVLDPEDDVAHVKWGGSWRMPTSTEIEELIKKCTWTWTAQSGIMGYKVTSKSNDNYIFLPAAGWYGNSSLGGVGANGNYWPASLDESSPDHAWYVYFNSSGVSRRSLSRNFGYPVRPVCP